MPKAGQFNLQDRLIDYSVRIIRLCESFPNTKSGNHVAAQLLRSGTSPAANYGEAQSAESKADFVHKLKISLKELRETQIWLLIIAKADLLQSDELLAPLLKETDELIAILYSCIATSKKRPPALNLDIGY